MSISIGDIREYVMDRSADDNPLIDDMEFSDEEIERAMKMATRAYNSFPPVGHLINYEDGLPDDTNIFFAATAEYLYRALSSRLRRSDFEYKGGNVTVDEYSRKIAHLQLMIREERDAWQTEASYLKKTRNVRGFYGFFH